VIILLKKHISPSDEGYKCSICGKMCREHEYWDFFYGRKRQDTSHTIIKRRGCEQKALNMRVLKNHDCSGVVCTCCICAHYGGMCARDNFCPRLKNPRGGDFGWGECIYMHLTFIVNVPVLKHTINSRLSISREEK